MSKKRIVIFILSAFIFILPFIVSPPKGLSVQGFKALAIFVVCVLWWITGVVPLMITGLLAIVSFPILGIAKSSEIYSYFGNTAVFFLIGSFILASAFMRSRLSKRLSFIFINHFGKNSRSLVLSIQYLATFMAFWVSAYAVIAMMIPIVSEINETICEQKNGQKLATALSFSAMWGSIIGSSLTLLGGARGPLANAILQATTRKSVGFTQWTLATLPIVISVSIVATLILMKITPRDVNVLSGKKILQERVKAMGRITSKEKSVGLVMLFTILAWFFLSSKIGLANIALISVIVLFIFKLTTWHEVEEDVNWGIILMYGGAIVLGYALNHTDVSTWLVGIWRSVFPNPEMFLITISVFSLALTEVMSNSAVVAFLMPIALSNALSLGANSRVLALAVTVPSGLAFMLPMSSPVVALTVSTGYVEVKDTVRYGIILEMFVVVIIAFFNLFYWPRIF